MTSRRTFLQQLSTLTLGSFLAPSFLREMEAVAAPLKGVKPEQTVHDEDFWGYIRTQFTVTPGLINLNNGGVSPQPKPVQDAHIRYYQYCNEGPSYYMWRQLDQGREPLRQRLADLTGCSADEVAINRNSTEALNTVVFGLPLKAGDEVVVTRQDYPNMLNAWKQREKREGIKLVWLNLELPLESEKEIVEQFTSAFTERTKLVHLTHMINWTGQLMPAKRIIEEAHKKGIEVLLDSAHTFAHIDYTVKDLQPDYMGTSLHKWLCAPFGSGLLYVKKDKIGKIWPLLANDKPEGDDIRKFESVGTRSFASEMAIGAACDFHELMGPARKQARLRHLKNYWAKEAKQIPGVRLNTSLLPEWSGALANFSIEGMKPEEIDAKLMSKYKIHTVAINWENIHGVRVTPHVYTAPRDLDRLLEAIQDIAKKG